MAMSDEVDSSIVEAANSDTGLLFVEVANEIFAIPINSTKEVIEKGALTRVPMCPDIVSGVINVRGSVVPVIDASQRLGLNRKDEYDKYSCIVLYESKDNRTQESMSIGLLVARVRSIEVISDHTIVNKPAFGSIVPGNFILTMINVNGMAVPVLNMKALFDSSVLNELILQFQRRNLRV